MASVNLRCTGLTRSIADILEQAPVEVRLLHAIQRRDDERARMFATSQLGCEEITDPDVIREWQLEDYIHEVYPLRDADQLGIFLRGVDVAFGGSMEIRLLSDGGASLVMGDLEIRFSAREAGNFAKGLLKILGTVKKLAGDPDEEA